jgi:hypothetical protein
MRRDCCISENNKCAENVRKYNKERAGLKKLYEELKLVGWVRHTARIQ